MRFTRLSSFSPSSSEGGSSTTTSFDGRRIPLLVIPPLPPPWRPRRNSDVSSSSKPYNASNTQPPQSHSQRTPINYNNKKRIALEKQQERQIECPPSLTSVSESSVSADDIPLNRPQHHNNHVRRFKTMISAPRVSVDLSVKELRENNRHTTKKSSVFAQPSSEAQTFPEEAKACNPFERSDYATEEKPPQSLTNGIHHLTITETAPHRTSPRRKSLNKKPLEIKEGSHFHNLNCDLIDDDVSTFSVEWTPQDSAYGAACPICGWIPKPIRRVIEASLVVMLVAVFIYMGILLSINLMNSHAEGNYSPVETDDDYYVSNTVNSTVVVYDDMVVYDDGVVDDDYDDYQ